MNGTRMSGRQHDHVSKVILAILFCGVIPFVFHHGEWSKILAKAYSLTILIFFLIFYVHSKSIKDWWFWRAVLLVVPLHSAIVLGLVVLNLNFPEIDYVPRMAYGALTILFVAEGRAALWIVARYQSKSGHV